MRRASSLLLLLLLALPPLACAGSGQMGVSAGYYPRHYYGRGPYWRYYDPIVIDGCRGGDCVDIDPPGRGAVRMTTPILVKPFSRSH